MPKHLLDGKTAEERKTYPVYSGVICYFRDALYRIAQVSYEGNQQHNPGQPVHWARGKSTDQLDCVVRHLMEVDRTDFSYETELALAAVAWRALADLQLFLEGKYDIKPPPHARSSE